MLLKSGVERIFITDSQKEQIKKELPIFFLPRRGTLRAEKRNKKRAYLSNTLVVLAPRTYYFYFS